MVYFSPDFAFSMIMGSSFSSETSTAHMCDSCGPKSSRRGEAEKMYAVYMLYCRDTKYTKCTRTVRISVMLVTT